jgi:hypothetical protein
MPFQIVEIDGTVPVSITGAVFGQGLVSAVAPLAVSVAAAYYEIGGAQGQYAGVGSVAVTNNATNYVYLDSAGSLVINTTGFPAGTHLRLAQVFTSGGVILNCVDVRPFFTATSPQTADDTFVFAAGGLGLSTTPRFLPFGLSSNNAPTSPVSLRAARAGTFSNLRVKHNLTGAGGSITYTLRVNGVDSSLTVTATAGSSGGVDLTHSVAVAADDFLDLRVTKAATLSNSPSDITATLEFNI